jgi:hypothetical protein
LVPRRTNLVIILGMMQVAKKIPFDDPQVLNICRAVYIASNLIILAVNFYIKTVIDKKKGTSEASPVHASCLYVGKSS